MPQRQDIFSTMGGKVKFHHGAYNPTSDAVWLAAFANPAKNVLDVGVGTGGASLCLMAHYPDACVTGIDISDIMLTECAKNAKLNGRAIELLNEDILNWKTDRTFDLVITNPPYFKGTPAKHGAHHNANLGQWIKKCVARVRPRGYFCAIVDSHALTEVTSALYPTCGDVKILPLFGSKNIAERTLILARLGVRGGTTLFSGLSMNNELILRDGLTISDVFTRIQNKCSIS